MLAHMTRLASLLALAVLAACTAETAGPASPTPAQASVQAPGDGALVDLTASPDALKTNFNAHRGEARFLTLLSPS
jgi:PBP1b-binding outer membrane lipoprotein LpoB